jgi:hypothetical protein
MLKIEENPDAVPKPEADSIINGNPHIPFMSLVISSFLDFKQDLHDELNAPHDRVI